MVAKAKGANFNSNHGYWILTDKEYQDYQAKDAQIERLENALIAITIIAPSQRGRKLRIAQGIAQTALDAIKEAKCS